MADELIFPPNDPLSLIEDLGPSMMSEPVLTSDINPSFPHPELVNIPEIIQPMIPPKGAPQTFNLGGNRPDQGYTPISQLMKQTEQLAATLDRPLNNAMTDHVDFNRVPNTNLQETIMGTHLQNPVLNSGTSFVNPNTPTMKSAHSLVIQGQRIPISTPMQHNASVLSIKPPSSGPISPLVQGSSAQPINPSIDPSEALKQNMMLKLPTSQTGNKPPMKGQIVKTPDQRLMFVTEVNGKRVGYLIQQPKQSDTPQSTSPNIASQQNSQEGRELLNNNSESSLNIESRKNSPSEAINFRLDANKEIIMTHSDISSKGKVEPLIKTDMKSLREKLLNLRNPLNMRNNMKPGLSFPIMNKSLSEKSNPVETLSNEKLTNPLSKMANPVPATCVMNPASPPIVQSLNVISNTQMVSPVTHPSVQSVISPGSPNVQSINIVSDTPMGSPVTHLSVSSIMNPVSPPTVQSINIISDTQMGSPLPHSSVQSVMNPMSPSTEQSINIISDKQTANLISNITEQSIMDPLGHSSMQNVINPLEHSTLQNVFNPLMNPSMQSVNIVSDIISPGSDNAINTHSPNLSFSMSNCSTISTHSPNLSFSVSNSSKDSDGLVQNSMASICTDEIISSDDTPTEKDSSLNVNENDSSFIVNEKNFGFSLNEIPEEEDEGQEIEFSENDLTEDFEENIFGENVSPNDGNGDYETNIKEEESETKMRPFSTDDEDSVPLSMFKSDKNEPSLSPIEQMDVDSSEKVKKKRSKKKKQAKESASIEEVSKEGNEEEGEKKSKKKKRKSKKVKDPRAPSRPIPAYQSFFRDITPTIKEQNPELSFGEVSKMVSQRWDTLDETEKKKYLDINESARMDYKTKMGEYKELVGQEITSPPTSPNQELDASLEKVQETTLVDGDPKKKPKRGRKRKRDKKSPEVKDAFDFEPPGENDNDEKVENDNDEKVEGIEPGDNAIGGEKKILKKRGRPFKQTKTPDDILDDPPSSPSLPSSDSSSSDEDSESAITRIREKAAELHKYLKQQRRTVEHLQIKKSGKRSRSTKMEVETVDESCVIGESTELNESLESVPDEEWKLNESLESLPDGESKDSEMDSSLRESDTDSQVKESPMEIEPKVGFQEELEEGTSKDPAAVEEKVSEEEVEEEKTKIESGTIDAKQSVPLRESADSKKPDSESEDEPLSTLKVKKRTIVRKKKLEVKNKANDEESSVPTKGRKLRKRKKVEAVLKKDSEEDNVSNDENEENKVTTGRTLRKRNNKGLAVQKSDSDEEDGSNEENDNDAEKETTVRKLRKKKTATEVKKSGSGEEDISNDENEADKITKVKKLRKKKAVTTPKSSSENDKDLKNDKVDEITKDGSEEESSLLKEVSNKLKEQESLPTKTDLETKTTPMEIEKTKEEDSVSEPPVVKTGFKIPKKSNKENGLPVIHGPRICVRQTCEHPAKLSRERGGQYCSNECLVLYCREVFESWVLDRQTDEKAKT